MIELPDLSGGFAAENAFHLTAQVPRVAKVLAHAELYRMVADRPGTVVECGVFKGASFSRFAAFRQLFSPAGAVRLVGFDTFDEFPATEFEGDVDHLATFIDQAGSASIGADQLQGLLDHRGVGHDVELVAGDLTVTAAEWAVANPDASITLLHVDVDIYEPSKAIFEHLWPLVAPGGVMILDDYGTWEGETAAFHEYFGDDAPEIQRLAYIETTPVYVIKP
ncbi:MAG: putative NADP-dependent oxidoreductase [Ilumatobacteraceae bacterium]|nr:putative NADP-dependent oxidoreductase [Ilumatobacteraceae bacterium]